MPRKKWNAENRDVRVGDFVIVADPNAVRREWHMGKVAQVFPGKDGLVRNVQVKMATGTHTPHYKDVSFTRPKVILIRMGFPHCGGECCDD